MGTSLLQLLMIPFLFFGIVACVGLGRRLDARRILEETERERVVLTTVETSIYALLGLMIAFTFAGAAQRFDARRTLTIDEANAIGDAYARLDLLPAAAQPALRADFRSYALERLESFRALPDVEASNRHAAGAGVLFARIWRGSVAAAGHEPSSASLLLLPRLNDMSSLATTRAVLLQAKTPPLVLAVLVLMTLMCGVLVGNGFPGRTVPRLHQYGFALVLSLTLYVIVDLDHPRAGLIQLDYADQAMVDALAGMSAASN